MINFKIFFLFLFITFHCYLNGTLDINFIFSDSIVTSFDVNVLRSHDNFELKTLKAKPHPLLKWFKKNISTRQKIISAALAFPFPFGIVGLHRIYMGTSPHVPVIYIATFGGVFGVLPFIDFCILILDKKPERYFNNPRLFMWIEPERHQQTTSEQTP